MPHICFYFNFLRQHELALNYINDEVASFFQVFHEFRIEIRFLSCKICSKSLINSRKLCKDLFIGLFEIINSNCQSPIFDLIFGISENWTSFCKMNNSAWQQSIYLRHVPDTTNTSVFFLCVFRMLRNWNQSTIISTWPSFALGAFSPKIWFHFILNFMFECILVVFY